MKHVIIFLIFSLFLLKSFGQTPKAIEADLLRSFKKIEYWSASKNENALDSLGLANTLFAQNLKKYTSKYSTTISYTFDSLIKAHLDISTSDDGLFRIYSWDTQTGGTMHFFENAFQFKASDGVKAILDTPRREGDNRPNYYKVYTLKAAGKSYYLAVSLGIGSTKDMGQSIQIFAIEKGKLDDDVKLIKTQSGMHSHLDIEYFFNTKKYPAISYNAVTQTISLPLISNKHKVTNKFITYKFTGKYFERVKS